MRPALLASVLALAFAGAMSGSLLAADLPEWELAAQEQIRQHRMGELTLVLRGKGGEPVAGAELALRQRRHHFGFGTAVNAGHFAQTAEDDPYRQRIVELFNVAVLENGHKWPAWERTNRRTMTIATTDWLRRRGIAIRGHTLLWQTKQFGKPMPADVWAEVLKAEAGEPADLDHVRRRIADHLEATTRQLAGTVIHWDVTNEITAHHHALQVLDPEHPPRTSPLIAEWYRAVHAADPDARLFVNDYSILVNRNDGHRQGYEATIQSLLDAGAPLHGIGMQCHVTSDFHRPRPAEIKERLDRFGRFGLPIWITEFDCIGKSWPEGEERIAAQTECFREILIGCFAHPAVEGFIMWGFWDGRHWGKNAPLYHQDWSPKPGLAIYRDLVFGQWWSEENATSDDQGRVSLRVFKGTHHVTVTVGEETYESEVAITGSDATQVLYLRN